MRVNLDPTKPKIGETLTKMLAVTFFIVLLTAAFFKDDSEVDAIVEANYYCEMVYLFITSSGENGYPDYRNQYEKICHLDRVKSVN